MRTPSGPRPAALLLLAAWLLAPASAPAQEAEAPAPSAEAADPWAVPPEGACAPDGGLRVASGDDAAAPFPFAPGDTLELARVEALQRFLPRPLWEYRERFFYEGMRLEIGPCYRDYAPPAFFQEATARGAGRASLGSDGGLLGWEAGLAFPPGAIDPADPQAGARWAWNAATRYQGAGLRGKFRVVDLMGRVGRAEPFEGEIFRMQLAHRADLPERATAFAKGNWWVAGGRFFEPTNAREYAWRQYRNDEALEKAARTDDLLAYLPTWRRVRRIPAVNVEGLYMPSFSVGVVPAQQLAVGGGAGAGAGGGGGVVSAGGVGAEGGTLQTRRSGFEGQELRPLLWDWRVIGLQDLLAPINVVSPMYPAEEQREFGPWGLSFASDRWDLRRALVLEGRIKGKPGDRGEARVLWYFDLQTLVPLFYMAYDAKDEPIDVGVFASRWSEDRPDYPRWPDDPARPVRVLDTMGAAFANLAEDGSWRRESWDLVATPPPDKQLKQMTSSTGLTKGR
ncbi:MAG TPA: DUF1329 domain-containing protein [Myxococcota bacterium]|nr:DUF1329 domain-containing protein [Myxococcota bacterium]